MPTQFSAFRNYKKTNRKHGEVDYLINKEVINHDSF